MIERSDRDGVAILTLKHGKANALDLELCEELQRQMAAIVASDVRAIVVTGTGTIFSAGVDLFRLLNEGESYARRFFDAMVSMFTEFFLLPRPVVAAVNGHAIAGGAIFTAASDYRFMSSGRIGVPELLVGVPFPALALEIVRFGRLEPVVYTGETMTPEVALSRGIVDAVTEPDQLLDRALERARQLGAIPRDAFRLTKRQLRTPYVAAARALADQDAQARDLWLAKPTHDAIRSYLERTVGKK
jgi:enoyl-CoA hydratase